MAENIADTLQDTKIPNLHPKERRRASPALSYHGRPPSPSSSLAGFQFLWNKIVLSVWLIIRLTNITSSHVYKLYVALGSLQTVSEKNCFWFVKTWNILQDKMLQGPFCDQTSETKNPRMGNRRYENFLQKTSWQCIQVTSFHESAVLVNYCRDR